MRVVIMILMLLALSMGIEELEHSNGHDILRELEGNNNNVYIIFFYAAATDGSTLGNLNEDYEKALTSRVLDEYPEFYYAKVDANNKDYSEVVKQCGIDVDELQKSPSILIMENGNGAWIHGPQTISKIEEYAPAYSKRSKNA